MKLFIQLYNDKFIQNLLSTKNIAGLVVGSVINKNIYKIHHQHKYTHYIFIDKFIDNEINEFITDNHDQTKIFIYHSLGLNQKIIDHFGNKVQHLTKENDPNSVKIPLMCNPIQLNNSISREKIISIFLDNCPEIPKEIIDHLYPNSTLPIRMYNHAGFVHPQNLGFLTEEEKIQILQKSEFSIIVNGADYILESLVCGCKPIAPDQIKHLDNNSYIAANATVESTYKDFLEKVILV